MLERVLGDIPRSNDPRLLVGMETSDDGGVYQLTDELAIINTVDYFAPIVDDAYTFGAIAVANALSDVYSMGGTPRTALNVVFWDAEFPNEILTDIVRGGADKLASAGCALVGGHTVRSPELMYGVAVTGTVHPTKYVRNCDSRPGDVLLLTKPLGVGILATAGKYGEAGDEELRPAVESMLQLNDVAAEVMGEFGAHAATDVTGFGLVGHAYEMAVGSGVTIRLMADRMPVLPHAFALVDADNTTRAARDNRAFMGAKFIADANVRKQLVSVVLDAETSGGLLISMPKDRADEAVQELRTRGYEHADIIGEVLAEDPGVVRLVE